MSRKNGQLARQPDVAGLPPWMAAMREAAQDGITEDDVRDIVKHQVDSAKKGDKDAIRFVFDYVLGSNQFKGATFIQNHNYGGDPAAPTSARPGSNEKLGRMQRRLQNGMPLHVPGDGPDADLS